MEEIYQYLVQILPKENVLKQEPMAKHTSFKIGGKADLFAKVNTVEELIAILSFVKEKQIPIYIMGNGSNVLVKDGGIRGIVVKLNFKEIIIQKAEEEILFHVGAGVALAQISQIALKQGATGLEFASGIPGTIRWWY